MLTDDAGELNLVVLRFIVDHIAQAMAENAEVILVSSIDRLGRRAIGFPRPSDTPTRRPATIGQVGSADLRVAAAGARLLCAGSLEPGRLRQSQAVQQPAERTVDLAEAGRLAHLE